MQLTQEIEPKNPRANIFRLHKHMKIWWCHIFQKRSTQMHWFFTDSSKSCNMPGPRPASQHSQHRSLRMAPQLSSWQPQVDPMQMQMQFWGSLAANWGPKLDGGWLLTGKKSDEDYPPVIKHGNGKSPMNAGFTRKFIVTYRCGPFSIAMFDYRRVISSSCDYGHISCVLRPLCNRTSPFLKRSSIAPKRLSSKPRLIPEATPNLKCPKCPNVHHV